MDCCKKKPDERLTFSKIIDKYVKTQYFKEILKELDATENIILYIWENALKAGSPTLPKENKEIEFTKFYDFLIKHFRLKKPEEIYYLKEVLRLPYFLKLGVPDPPTMTRENFAVIGSLFKFTKKRDDSFIERMLEVFKAEWFYGTVDRLEAQKQLEALTKSKNSTTPYFIVRFANSKQLCFTYKKKDGNWDHSNIEPGVALERESYAKYIEWWAQTNRIKHDPVTSLQKSFQPYNPPKKNK